jgi:hypothetical protein
VLRHVVERHQPGDAVWLYPSARLTFEYYERNLAPRTWREVQIYREGGISPQAQWSELQQLVGRPRVWCVFYHVTPPQEEQLTFMLDQVGARRDALHAPGAAVYLYDLSTTAAFRRR